ncbi:permease-like cell division protein FtsX [Marinomonas spartinae]|uniref:permease-like cell division protein FtsX n=1 Tax=Marinomonas spartinae TaxID=1792290 RepID=UPI0018F1E35C|nr:permease-like cell division protein FtsX [Marinomonas spartinae]MBJ7556068.1 cell division protein FtsX [Marinomonas spartinae]
MPQKNARRGATRQSVKATKHRWSKRSSFSLKHYLRQHQSTLTESFMRLLNYPLASVMTVMVIAIALTLPGSLYVLLKNVQSITNNWDKQSAITLYLFPQVDDTQALALSHRLSSRPDVASVDYISKEEGLRDFERWSGYTQLLSSLQGNPLPIVLKVIPKMVVSEQTLPALETLREQLAAQGEVQNAVLDAQWLERLANILSFGQRLAYALSILLIVAVLLIVGNTIRMAVESRRDEVLVMKLVGATDSYIRRPFLYMGLWFGILGGFFASLCILILSWWVSVPAEHLIELYGSHFKLQTFNADEIVLCLTISAFVGVSGAWIAVNRHIANIEL